MPQQSEGFNRGDVVTVRLHRPFHQDELDNRLVVIGSHDMVLDVINNLLAASGRSSSLISSHVGSLSGLQSLKAGECHLAPAHLLGSDGTYNNEAMSMFFKGETMAAIQIVGRRQGIIVPRGNPQNINSLTDLPGKSMINRQRGAGTRVLFDYLLKQQGLSAEGLAGYEHEVTTHLAVALAVRNGDCDFGIGIESAAKKMDCDFIFLADEAYEFITRPATLELPAMQALLALLQSDLFRDAVNALGGYETAESGQVRHHQA